MYLINDYQLYHTTNTDYIFCDSKAAKIPHKVLFKILQSLKNQKFYQISEEELAALANDFEVEIAVLKNILINQLAILKAQQARKFKKIYLNIADPLITEILQATYKDYYPVEVIQKDNYNYDKESLVIFYRNNYSNSDFKKVYYNLNAEVYLITAGIIHNILVLDNIYFKGSGLPTHISNLHQLIAFLHSNIPASKDNWLLFYRSLVKNNVENFPDPCINTAQKSYVAALIYQFAEQFTGFWKAPTLLDQIKYFWHVDLTNFKVHKEVAVHSSFSQYDMKLDLEQI